ncbi:hypothetical protein EAG_06409 [Camponotus floridanus]|uniref:Uncharacterized protein n=1 Tax=Camponotus floridanus TaxID=104421 RepID=E2B030_CAMFO|nr:hypothetical protein EAG_06409 [Camponotus floridanus]
MVPLFKKRQIRSNATKRREEANSDSSDNPIIQITTSPIKLVDRPLIRPRQVSK